MATATMSLTGVSIEYYQTMKTTEVARQKVERTQTNVLAGHVRLVAEACLFFPFFTLTRDTKKLVSLLEQFESFPSTVLLGEDVEKLPQELQDLFKKMCRVLQLTETLGLNRGILRGSLVKLGTLSQEVKGFADRFADAQNKLRSRVPAEDVEQYRESFAAYETCGPTHDQFEHEDRQSVALRF
jgi:hypothetical protein